MSNLGGWKIAAIILGLCSIVLAYRIFDQGITRTYLNASQETSAMHIKLLTGLVEYEWLGLPEEKVMSRLQAYVASQPLNSVVLKRDPETNATYLEGIRFEFQNGKLKKII